MNMRTTILISLAFVCASTVAMASSITGKISSAATGQPISHGYVEIYNVSGTFLGLASPDGAGLYTYGGLAAGTYFARTSSTGFFDELWNDIPCAQGNCIVTSGTPISVASSPVTVNFALATGGSITGKVSAAGSGQPISQGYVEIYNASGTFLGLAAPDAAGNYSYGGLAAGAYFARTSSTGFSDQLWNGIPCADGNCVVTSGTPISVASSPVTVNFSLGMGASITGKVSAAGTGLPISHGYVEIYNASGTFLGLAAPDAAGNYAYGGLAAGAYFARTSSTGFADQLWNGIPCADGNCVVTMGTPITVASSPVAVNFVLAAGGAITGKVSAAGTGQPIPRGYVEIYNASGTFLGLAAPDSAGNYTYSGLAACTYFARTSSTGFYDELWNDIACAQGFCVVTSGTSIAVASSPVTVNFVLATGGSITGKVSLAGTGQPISQGYVEIYNASGTFLGLAAPNGLGNYVYGGLAAGTYFARTSSTGFIDELWNNIQCAQGDCIVTSGTPISVSGSTNTIANFTLEGNTDPVFHNGFETSAPAQFEAAELPGAFRDEIELDGLQRSLQKNLQHQAAPTQ